jgi:hypothetical protein
MIDRLLVFLCSMVQLLCFGLIWRSCFPGELEDITEFSLIVIYSLSIPLVIILVILIMIRKLVRLIHQQQDRPLNLGALPSPKPPRRYPKRLALLTCGVLFATSILLKLNLPQSIAFAISSPAFTSFLANSAQVERFCESTTAPPINQRFGWYWVQECDRDPRGGTYFKTNDGSGIIWYAEAHGFAYRPNAKGSRRFSSGKKQDVYEYAPVWGNWHWFKAGKTY